MDINFSVFVNINCIEMSYRKNGWVYQRRWINPDLNETATRACAEEETRMLRRLLRREVVSFVVSGSSNAPGRACVTYHVRESAWKRCATSREGYTRGFDLVTRRVNRLRKHNKLEDNKRIQSVVPRAMLSRVFRSQLSCTFDFGCFACAFTIIMPSNPGRSRIRYPKPPERIERYK